MKRWTALAVLLPLLAACDRGTQAPPAADSNSSAVQQSGASASASTSASGPGTPAPAADAKTADTTDNKTAGSSKQNGKAGISTSQSSGSSSEYTIAPGDTLSGIAREHGLKREDLARWNNIDNPDRIRAGQTLKLTGPDS